MQKTTKKQAALLLLLLAAGLALMLFYAAHKQGYHEDEMYTYELTNYPGGFYALQDGYFDTWHDGSFYQSVFRVSRPFQYSIPWTNQQIDTHPPLYYCMVYTAESLFPALGLPWSGLLPNFIFCLLGALVLYAAAHRLTGRFWPSWLAAAAWLLSVGVQGMAIFTRMYCQLMLVVLLMVFAHLSLYRTLCAGQRPRWIFPALAGITIAGTLTQYYFLVFCFFFCGLFALWMLLTRRLRTLLAYCMVELVSLFAAYKAFPYMRGHIFSGGRGQEAFASFFSLTTLGQWFASLLRVVQLLGAQFGGALLWLALWIAAAILLRRRGTKIQGDGLFVLFLVLASAAYVLVISKIAPFEVDRYYVLIYAPMILASAKLLACLSGDSPRGELLMTLVLVPVAVAHFTDPNGYLYADNAARTEALASTAGLPAVVLNNGGYEVAADLFLTEFAQREAVYQTKDAGSAADLQSAAAARDLHDGFVLYGYNYTADELLALARSALDVKDAVLLTDGSSCPTYYITLAE